MIDNIPVGAIIRTLEREQRMVEDDLAHQRPVSLKEAESILNFCYFVEAVREGSPGWAFTLPLPPEHLTFYRKTLDRLIAAQHLPELSRRGRRRVGGKARQGSVRCRREHDGCIGGAWYPVECGLSGAVGRPGGVLSVLAS